jgi:phosphoglycolate phosphatase
LFDLDGTLTDPKEGITNSVAYSLESFGIHIENRDDLTCFIGPPLQTSFEEYYGFDKQKSMEAVNKYREYFADKGIFENALYDEIAGLLETLKHGNYKIILATSKPTVFAKRILDYFDLTKYFDFIKGSELDGSMSKKGDIIAYIMEALNLPKDKAVMIGDRKHDIIGAKENGIDSIGVIWGYGSRGELETAGATVIVDSVTELSYAIMQE